MIWLLPDSIPVIQWHAHEMILGFISEALAGFFANGCA